MSVRKAITYAMAAAVGITLSILDVPGNVIAWSFLAIIGVMMLWIAALVMWPVATGQVQLKAPPPPPIECPICGHTEHEWRSGGLWDGRPDPVTGKRPCGSYSYGVCKRCGCRWGQWDESPAYAASEEEWEREVERYRREIRTPYR
jgi:hypothetical protein